MFLKHLRSLLALVESVKMVKFSQVMYFVLLAEGQKGSNFHCELKFHVAICNTNTKCHGGLYLMNTAYSSTSYISSGQCELLCDVFFFFFLSSAFVAVFPFAE